VTKVQLEVSRIDDQTYVEKMNRNTGFFLQKEMVSAATLKMTTQMLPKRKFWA